MPFMDHEHKVCIQCMLQLFGDLANLLPQFNITNEFPLDDPGGNNAQAKCAQGAQFDALINLLGLLGPLQGESFDEITMLRGIS